MKKFFIIFALAFMLIVPVKLFAAGACTMDSVAYDNLVYVIWDWTSSAAGAVSGSGCTTGKFSGMIMNVITDPDDTAAPTDNYDIDIEDITDVVITGTYLDDRDTANIERLMPKDANGDNIFLYKDSLELVIANAGDTKQGRVVLILWR